MCRLMLYLGPEATLSALIVEPEHSLIRQSVHSKEREEPLNGDGFGIGWYEEGQPPRTYRSTHPAWNDRNLRELAAGVSSPLFFSHIRASTGTAIQETNTHPFRYGDWLWMHNGLIREFPTVKRELVLAVVVAREHDRQGQHEFRRCRPARIEEEPADHRSSTGLLRP